MTVNECRNLKNTLETEIRRSSNVFIIGHKNPDFDSIGSAVGLYTLARHYKKKAYIIVDDDATKIEPGVKRIMDEKTLPVVPSSWEEGLGVVEKNNDITYYKLNI